MFSHIPTAPPNAVLGLALEAKLDTFEQKVDLTIGAYRSEQGNPVTLPSVRAAEKVVFDANEGHEYLRQDGLLSFTSAAQKLLLGEECSVLNEGKVASQSAVIHVPYLVLALSYYHSLMS